MIDTQDIHHQLNASDNPYYIDEEYFHALKAYHLSDVGFGGKVGLNGSITWIITVIFWYFVTTFTWGNKYIYHKKKTIFHKKKVNQTIIIGCFPTIIFVELMGRMNILSSQYLMGKIMRTTLLVTKCKIISEQQVSITRTVSINEGRTARLKCYTLNVPNVTVRKTNFKNYFLVFLRLCCEKLICKTVAQNWLCS